MPKGDRLKLKADPEDGTTPIANLLLEALAMCKLSGLHRGAIAYLWRMTYGWTDGNGKRLKEAKISLSKWKDALDTSSPRASVVLSELESKNIIFRRMDDAWGGYYYSLNTDIKSWNSDSINTEKLAELVGITDFITITKNITITELDNSNDSDNTYQEHNETVIKNETEQLSKTKRPSILYKESINKSKSTEDDEKVFSDFVKVYEETVGNVLNQKNADDIKEFSTEYPLSWFKRVCEITRDRKPKYDKVQYMRKILKNWEENGFENKTTNNNKPPEPTRKYRELKQDDPDYLDYLARMKAVEEKKLSK